MHNNSFIWYEGSIVWWYRPEEIQKQGIFPGCIYVIGGHSGVYPNTSICHFLFLGKVFLSYFWNFRVYPHYIQLRGLYFFFAFTYSVTFLLWIISNILMSFKYVELNKLVHVLNEPVKQDERELKRQKRKQSNRESAKRSRMKKQV